MTKYTEVRAPLEYLKNLQPPEFYVRGETHIMLRHRNKKDYKKPTQESFFDEPGSYIRWNLWGRLFLLWHWDNAYSGDVYIYPMHRKGFKRNSLLRAIHKTMRFGHWLLYVLALAAPLVLLWKWKRKTLPVEQRALLVPALGFVYFIAVLYFISWLPRYTIPVRPFGYIMAVATLSWSLPYLKHRFSQSLRSKSRKAKTRKKLRFARILDLFAT